MARDITARLYVPDRTIANQTVADYGQSGLGSVAEAIQFLYHNHPYCYLAATNQFSSEPVVDVTTDAYLDIFSRNSESTTTQRSLFVYVLYENAAAVDKDLYVEVVSSGDNITLTLPPSGGVGMYGGSFALTDDFSSQLLVSTPTDLKVWGIFVFDSLSYSESGVSLTSGYIGQDTEQYDGNSPYSINYYYELAANAALVARNNTRTKFVEGHKLPYTNKANDSYAGFTLQNGFDYSIYFDIAAPQCPYNLPVGTTSVECPSVWYAKINSIESGQTCRIIVTTDLESFSFEVDQTGVINDDPAVIVHTRSLLVPRFQYLLNCSISMVNTTPGEYDTNATVTFYAYWSGWDATLYATYLQGATGGLNFYPLVDENGDYIVEFPDSTNIVWYK